MTATIHYLNYSVNWTVQKHAFIVITFAIMKFVYQVACVCSTNLHNFIGTVIKLLLTFPYWYQFSSHRKPFVQCIRKEHSRKIITRVRRNTNKILKLNCVSLFKINMRRAKLKRYSASLNNLYRQKNTVYKVMHKFSCNQTYNSRGKLKHF